MVIPTFNFCIERCLFKVPLKNFQQFDLFTHDLKSFLKYVSKSKYKFTKKTLIFMTCMKEDSMKINVEINYFYYAYKRCISYCQFLLRILTIWK